MVTPFIGNRTWLMHIDILRSLGTFLLGDNMKVNVGEIGIFYEKIGRGKPLVFLHGNGEDHKTFESLVKALKGHYTCYLIDSRNHGKSAKNLPMHYDDMADDIYSLLIKLQINKPIVFGFSDGAIIGMILAFTHQDLIDKLILAGGSLNPAGVKKQYLKMMEDAYQKTKNPLIELMLNEPHITSDDLKKITCPTLVLAGENDLIKYSHTLKMHKGIQDSHLIIIKNHNHESYIMNSDYLTEIILNFT